MWQARRAVPVQYFGPFAQNFQTKMHKFGVKSAKGANFVCLSKQYVTVS